MIDDLDRPLGQDRKPPPEQGGAGRWVAAGLVVVVIAVGVFVSRLSGAPGGEPEAVARIQPLAPPLVREPPPASAATATATGAAAAESAPASSARPNPAQQGELENGVRVFRGAAAAPNSVIIRVPDHFAAPLAAAPDPRLTEKSRFGLLPRRGKDGLAPSEFYARPESPAKPGPRIAIAIGGMGLDPAATDEAIAALPAAVSLAFAPYGAQIERLATAAREAGHETLLQAPMESFNPADSAPHMLQIGEANRLSDDLHWQMSRFSGYFGLVNFLGGRLTADRAATDALMTELSERGVAYFDDGSSPQSLAAEVAGAKSVSFGKADVRLDESRKPEAIDAALLRLETLAREKGLAVGFAAGLPGAAERIARFANELSQRGVTLVPLSTAIRARGAAVATTGSH